MTTATKNGAQRKPRTKRVADRPIEQIVIGGAMRYPENLKEAIATIKTDQVFQQHPHQCIWRAMVAMHAEGKSIDPTTLYDRLVKMDAVADIGGPAYLVDLWDAPTGSKIDGHCRILGELFLRRSLLNQLDQWRADIEDAGTSPAAIAGKIKAQIDAATSNAIVDQGGANDGRPKWQLELECLADVKPEYVEWLWPNVWMLGALNLLTGNPGAGKSFLCCDLAARVTTGGVLPDGSGKAPLGDVLYMTTEDSYAAVVIHRIKAAGGDLKRIHRIVRKWKTNADGQTDSGEFTIGEVDVMLDAVAKMNGLKLIILDPITSYIGEIDANANMEVRRVLERFQDLAREKGFAAVMITHDKKLTTAAIHSAIGSLAFTAVPRVSNLLAKDPESDDKTRRLLLPIKNNYAPDSTGRAFNLKSKGGGDVHASIVWDENPEHRTADEVKQMAAKVMTFAAKEVSEEETSKRRQIRVLEIVDGAAGENDGWIPVSDIKDRCTFSGSTLGATIYDLVTSEILEQRSTDKILPNGGKYPGGQKVVRRKRHVL